MSAPERVEVTEAGRALLRDLVSVHGPVMIHQSGGCCDGSAPMCYPEGEFRVGQRDVRLGVLDLGDDVAGVPVWISGPQFAAWRHTQLVVDAIPGRGAGFSLENPTGKRFLARARTFTDEELAALDDLPPTTGADLG